MDEILSFTVRFLDAAAWCLAAGVGVCVIGAGTYWIAKKLARSARQIAAVSLVGTVLIGGMVVVGTDDAGAKPSTNDVTQVEGGTNTTQQTEGDTNTVTQTGGDLTGTNGTGGVGSPLVLGLYGRPNLGLMFETVTDEEIVQGWRVVSVSSNALAVTTFTMPPHATVWEDARDFGAGWGSWKIPFGGWRFTYGDIGWTNGFAWVEGYFRSRFNNRANEIRLLSDRLALCPAANWSRYNLTASRAWSATNCHADAYIGCTWLGGEGVAFSNPHSLTTTVSWHSTNADSWATNHVDLVTKEKYAPTGQYVNPSRLVWGTNAVLKVDANPSGLFSPSESRLIDGGQFPLWRGMFETSSGQDWGLETQRGFYGIGDTVGDVIEDVLMYGVDSRGEDIPGCWVKGLRKKVKLNIPTDEIHVGADYIRKTDEEVYAK